MNHEAFKALVWDYYAHNQRDLPWRRVTSHGTCDPYYVLVSEFMLQQTQVNRVIPKFEAFISRFPSIQVLASAETSEVISMWNGLGYNRRAKYLHDAAVALTHDLIWTVEQLVARKGIGPNTAAAVYVYSYNKPLVFIETNIRTVFIHHYFESEPTISDTQLAPVIKETLDTNQPREWYWALMDYGTYLKKTVGNSASRSVHYKKQSVFEGSNRQLRGQIIRVLTAGPTTSGQLRAQFQDDRLSVVLTQLQKDGLVNIRGKTVTLG